MSQQYAEKDVLRKGFSSLVAELEAQEGDVLQVDADGQASVGPSSGGGGSLPSGEGSPAGVVTPASGIGSLYVDSSVGALYVASGVTNADWVCVGGQGDNSIAGLTTGISTTRLVAPDTYPAVLTDVGAQFGTHNGVYWNVDGDSDGSQKMKVQTGPGGEHALEYDDVGVLTNDGVPIGGSGLLQSAVVEISPAQLLALADTPVDILASAGSGFLNILLYLVGSAEVSDFPYTIPGNLAVQGINREPKSLAALLQFGGGAQQLWSWDVLAFQDTPTNIGNVFGATHPYTLETGENPIDGDFGVTLTVYYVTVPAVT